MSDFFYVLICRDCTDASGGDALEMPFGSPEDRGRWAAEHKRGTGHDSWFVVDVPRATTSEEAP